MVHVPAGWVLTANELHRNITALVGPFYEVVQEPARKAVASDGSLPSTTTLASPSCALRAHRITAGLCAVCGGPRPTTSATAPLFAPQVRSRPARPRPAAPSLLIRRRSRRRVLLDPPRRTPPMTILITIRAETTYATGDHFTRTST